MYRYLLRALSGAVLLLGSVVLLSTRRYGNHYQEETVIYQNLSEGLFSRWAQQKMETVGVAEDGSHKEPEFEKPQGRVKHSAVGKGLLLEDLFIAVKTTHKFHQTRIKLLLDTWISRVKEQVGMNIM